MKSDQIESRIQEGLEQAREGQFVPHDEMEKFFAQHIDTTNDLLWIDECMRRESLVDKGRMQLIKADEVMSKYRK